MDDSSCTTNRKARTIYLSGNIDHIMALQFRKALKRFEQSSPTEPVIVEINSDGGDLDATFMMLDTMSLAPTPICTIVTGMAMSAATLILAAGTYRMALPNAQIMVHQGIYDISGKFSDLMNDAKEIARVEELSTRLFTEFTKQAPGFWESVWEKGDYHMDPALAIKLGVIDEVVQAGARR
jgi:ATP-dependent Clp protease protease subunit